MKLSMVNGRIKIPIGIFKISSENNLMTPVARRRLISKKNFRI